MTSAAAPLALLTFRLGEATFALPAITVREIVHAVAVAPLPRAPAVVEGVINVRGTIVPVLDVRGRFGLPPEPLHPAQHFILADTRARLVALRVDRALDLTMVPADAVQPAAVAPGAEYVRGVARLPDGLLVINDLDAFLSLDEASALAAAMDGAGSGGAAPREAV